ncbi:MAG: hypothetical protein IPI66_02780 [Chitinophagaceae bacterium]|nr:hypothetical protein [Chitinophagaceae bacterium]MBL0055107.1 hypothetical protein [Chitinophagaceae bacterium]
MRCLLFSSCFIWLTGCVTVYKELPAATGNAAVLQTFKPDFSVALYSASIDVLDNHLSGLLLIKKMPDSSIRMVFSNEVGFKFFDFEFSSGGGFKVYSIIKKMNRKAVIKTLRHDFELVLMQGLDPGKLNVKKDGDGNLYYIYPAGKGFSCYVTNSGGTELLRLERSSKQEPVATTIMRRYVNGIPDTIGITHHKVDFTIGLKRLER